MKKLTAILLVCVLAFSLAVFGVNAEENDRFSTYTSEGGSLRYIDLQTGYEYKYLAEGENSDGSKFLLVLDYGACCDELFYKAVGDYMLFNPQTDGGTEGPLAIIKDNDVLGVYRAYDRGWIEDKAFYDAVKKTKEYNNYIRIIGDIDNDGDLTVLDATKIQKNIADGVKSRDNNFADFNRDGRLSVLDASGVQKRIAGLI